MEEEQSKRKYNKAKENDRRRETSRLNMAKARQRKLELLSLGKELHQKKLMESDPSDSESSDSSSSSDSDDSDVIVIAPRKKKQEKERRSVTKKRRPVTKKQVIKIVNPAPEKAPVTDSKEDFFTKTLLSKYK